MDAFETLVCEASKPLRIISNQWFGACIKLPKSHDFSFTYMFENFNGSPLEADLYEPMNHCLWFLRGLRWKFINLKTFLMTYLFNKKEELYLIDS